MINCFNPDMNQREILTIQFSSVYEWMNRFETENVC